MCKSAACHHLLAATTSHLPEITGAQSVLNHTNGSHEWQSMIGRERSCYKMLQTNVVFFMFEPFFSWFLCCSSGIIWADGTHQPPRK